jgi:hypothetical protein
VDRTLIQRTAALLLAEPIESRSLTPDAIWFLLHACVEHGVARAREHVELGLTCALDAVDVERDACRRIAWLELLSDASAVADDPRLIACVQRCLGPAIDQLESVVRHSYEPGEGLLRHTCIEQLRYANALLSAFQLTGRLPYGMLAEELVQSASRRWWDEPRSSFADDREAPTLADGFLLNSYGLQALCRVAALYADPEYQAAAVSAPQARYASDARRILLELSPMATDHPAHAAQFGRALLAWFALEPNLQ